MHCSSSRRPRTLCGRHCACCAGPTRRRRSGTRRTSRARTRCGCRASWTWLRRDWGWVAGRGWTWLDGSAHTGGFRRATSASDVNNAPALPALKVERLLHLKDRVSYVFGVLGIILVAYVLGKDPGHFDRVYSFLVVASVLYRCVRVGAHDDT
eukprot:Unigene9617_Nuclearia_a/m.29386 Unigene9617_Nuclearia_a/g.29386  ORF Unigene9617_Nuclearia_a/g.29386 Unigene9617_Nuclearia_a/m.29386 type:complete len:153 (+) Unigene9617_Nuclearia_a:49-507(+)